MIRKLVLAIAVAAVAVSFAPTLSHAKKMKAPAPKPCTAGMLSTGAANQWNWAMVSMCGADGKMYSTLMACYVPSGLCPK